MRERFVGCLIGCAIGDALGMPVEGWTRRSILDSFGEVRDFKEGRGLAPGSYTDDTQLTLVLVESIIRCKDFDPSDFAQGISEWRNYAVGPGFTSMCAATRLSIGFDWRESGLGSAGCGSAMRASPIGLLNIFRPRKMRKDAEQSSLITHTDPRAIAGSVAMASATSLLAKDPTCTGEEFLTEVRGMVGHISSTFYDSMTRTMEFDGMDIQRALEQIGTSGYVVETVNASLFIVSQSESFEEGVIHAVNAGGDTDSLGAMVGSLLGARFGVANIPRRWKTTVQDRNRIVNLGELLYSLVLS